MAAITASLVNELRAKTGQGMMECKKMLTQVEGDLEKAIAEFRKKGVKTSIAERAATEGRVFAATTADKSTSVAIEINCNTDFTAKSELVEKALEKAAHKLLHAPTLNLSDDAELKSELTALSQQTGENVVLGRAVVVTGTTGSYLYSTAGKGKIAVLLSIQRPAFGRSDLPPRHAHRRRATAGDDPRRSAGRRRRQGERKSPSSKPRPAASRSRSPRRSPKAR